MGEKELSTGMDRSIPLLLMVNVGKRLPGSPWMDMKKDLLFMSPKAKLKGLLSFPMDKKEEVCTQWGRQPRPQYQYEKHLGIEGGQSSFGISTGEHENKTGRGRRYQRP